MAQDSPAPGEYPLAMRQIWSPAMIEDFLARLSPHDVLPVIIIAIVFGAALIATIAVVIAACVYRIRRDQPIATLKHNMINQGMSAEEIKTILEAGTKPQS